LEAARDLYSRYTTRIPGDREAARDLYSRYTIHIPNGREVTLGVTTFYDRQGVYQAEIVKA
jgi:polyphosphate kinase 2 (PPK2 family)